MHAQTHTRTRTHSGMILSLSLSWQSSTWTGGWKKTTFLFAESLAWHILIIRRFFSLHVLKSPVLGSAGSLYKAIYCIKCTHKHTHIHTHTVLVVAVIWNVRHSWRGISKYSTVGVIFDFASLLALCTGPGPQCYPWSLLLSQSRSETGRLQHV